MNDITLESYLIRDSYADEFERIALEGIGRTPLGLTAEEYIARSKALANEMSSTKNPANQKKCIEKFKDLVDNFSASVKSKKMSAPEAKTVIIAILGIAATVLISFGAVKLGAKIKNLLKRENPEEIESEVTNELKKAQAATESVSGAQYDNLGNELGGIANIVFNPYEHPNVFSVMLMLQFVVLPLLIIWKMVRAMIWHSSGLFRVL